MGLKQAVAPVGLKTWKEEGAFAGYASVFGVIDSQADMMMPGAFQESLKAVQKGRDIRLLWQHDTAQPVGKITAIKEDEYGLFIEGELLSDVQQGKEAYALLKGQAIKGLSIGYSPTRWEVDADTGVRFLYSVDLWEVSIVTFPANEMAGVVAV